MSLRTPQASIGPTFIQHGKFTTDRHWPMCYTLLHEDDASTFVSQLLNAVLKKWNIMGAEVEVFDTLGWALQHSGLRTNIYDNRSCSISQLYCSQPFTICYSHCYDNNNVLIWYSAFSTRMHDQRRWQTCITLSTLRERERSLTENESCRRSRAFRTWEGMAFQILGA